MWFKKNLNRIAYSFQKWNLSKNKESINYQLLDLMHLDPSLFSKRDRNRESITDVSVIFQNISEYTRFIRICVQNTKNSAEIPYPAKLQRQTVTLEKFFIDDSNRYVDAQQSIDELKRLAIELKGLVEIQTESIGIGGYNRRIGYSTLISINALATQLRQYST